MISPRSVHSVLSCVAMAVVAAVVFPIPRARIRRSEGPARAVQASLGGKRDPRHRRGVRTGIQSRRCRGRGRPLDQGRQRGR